jgi:hypothetical protein
MYYDMEGNPMSMEEFCVLFESESRILARTELPGGCWVSTVWLGLDHSFGEGPPLIFESMVFASQEDHTDLDCIRYATREEAEAGHSALVTRWTGWTPGDPPPPEAEASFLTQFLDALQGALGERPITPEEAALNDQMVVMYPKDIAERMIEHDTIEGNEDEVHQDEQGSPG